VARSLIAQLDTTPIKGLSLSASGLLALADLQTIAQRTAITGGSSWLDSLVLAPGLHYQQAADALVNESEPTAVEHHDHGRIQHHAINNAATVNYLQKVVGAQTGKLVTVDVGLMPQERTRVLRRRRKSRRERDMNFDEDVEFDLFSHLLYLATPFFTIAAATFMILFEDCTCPYAPHQLSSHFSSHPPLPTTTIPYNPR
jgi:hypothetical protein